MLKLIKRLAAEFQTKPHVCSTWGCLLQVGAGSMWGPGPVCVPCRMHLRSVAHDDKNWTRPYELATRSRGSE